MNIASLQKAVRQSPNSAWPRTVIVIVSACAGIAALVLGYFLFSSTGGTNPNHPNRHAAATSTGSGAEPTRGQYAAASYDYPAPSGALPSTITVVYDEKHDRTRMTLTLRGIAATAPQPFRAWNTTLAIVSEFPGHERAKDVGELSVVATLSLTCSPPGVLAVSKPGAFSADGKSIPTRFLSNEKLRYTSKKKRNTANETLMFKVDTRDLLKLVQSQHLEGAFGAAALRFSPLHLRDLHEFAARLNPRG